MQGKHQLARENHHVNLEGWLVRQDLLNNPTQSAICRLVLALQTPTGQPRDKRVMEAVPYKSCVEVSQWNFIKLNRLDMQLTCVYAFSFNLLYCFMLNRKHTKEKGTMKESKKQSGLDVDFFWNNEAGFCTYTGSCVHFETPSNSLGITSLTYETVQHKFLFSFDNSMSLSIFNIFGNILAERNSINLILRQTIPLFSKNYTMTCLCFFWSLRIVPVILHCKQLVFFFFSLFYFVYQTEFPLPPLLCFSPTSFLSPHLLVRK